MIDGRLPVSILDLPSSILVLTGKSPVMPIKFRCAYCNQLMGIARRKAGTVVRCPACSGQVIVPNPSDEPTEKPPPPSAGEAELFERSDFDELFGSAAGGKRSPDRPVVAAPAPLGSGSAVAAEKPPELGFDVERVNVAPIMLADSGAAGSRPGIVLSPRLATILSVAAILALALAFALGLIVGRLLHSAPRESPSEQSSLGFSIENSQFSLPSPT
jgi:DNA-directed RNA polymerase subunit RPC12/RpoP